MTDPSGSAAVLAVTDLSVRFESSGEPPVHAVRELSFELASREVLAIVGESGCGKSTTALAVLGLLAGSAQVSGSVQLCGRQLLGLRERELARVRGRGIALIVQDPLSSLNPVQTIGWQVAEALQVHDRRLSRRQAEERAVELLADVGIPEPSARLRQYPHELSGGMRQRVVIAMAVANDPDVLVADEPTTALDVTVQAQVLETLERARERTSAAMLLITHDLGVVAGQADRVLVMYAGRAVEVGSAEDVFYRPAMPYTVGLLGSLPRLNVRGQPGLTPIAGQPPSLSHLPPGCPFAPRCPLAQEVCREQEPPLREVAGAGHVAACHFAEQVAGTDASELFAAAGRSA